MKLIFAKFGFFLAAFAYAMSMLSVNFCFFMFHQPSIPESVMKLKQSKAETTGTTSAGLLG